MTMYPTQKHGFLRYFATSMTLGLVLVSVFALPAHANRGDQERYAREWHQHKHPRMHRRPVVHVVPASPTVIYAPPVFVAPPAPPAGINLIIPLHID